MELRRASKQALGRLGQFDRAAAAGATILIYHRVGGGTGDELDLPVAAFERQLDVLLHGGHEVLALDDALGRLDAGDARPSVVLTFDDGFADVHDTVFPRLAERNLPFTVYLAAGLVGGRMTWEGSTASSQGSLALAWDDIAEMLATGLCTIGNHTFTHAPPERLDVAELDSCSDAIAAHLGQRPAHFAWTWGIPVPALLPAVRARFRSAATGDLGRNLPAVDRHALCRVPVRASDPMPFFEAKLRGHLWPERAYAGIVRTSKGALRLAGRG
jgi:peptidoglycan/xylan/chitin deacetylase (PgdA/CDA1 family)